MIRISDLGKKVPVTFENLERAITDADADMMEKRVKELSISDTYLIDDHLEIRIRYNHGFYVQVADRNEKNRETHNTGILITHQITDLSGKGVK